MKAWTLTAAGGLDHLTLGEVPDAAAPAAGEVRVAVRAAALNHHDLFVVAGLPGIDYAPPKIVGADAAGVVESVGPGVTRVRPGDRVFINPGISCRACEFCRRGEHSLCVRYRILGEHLPGTLAELVTVPEPNVAAIPELPTPLSWAEAAAFSLVTLTAWRMVVTRAQVRAEDWVLVWGIGGGVALTALRIAKSRGATVIATSSSADKLARARALGADHVLNHGTQQVAREVRALTGKRGVDVVVEHVGAKTWEESLRSLAKGGRVVTCGGTSGPRLITDVRPLFWHQHSILGSTMGNDAEYAEVVRRLGAGELRPVMDRVVPFAEARAAYAHLERGEQFGKVAVEIGG